MLIRCLFFLSLACLGCGNGEPPRLAGFPVHGKLLVDGKPAERAEVTLHSKKPLADETGRPVFPYAIVGADGTFDVMTYADGDGAPVGEYVLTVTWPRVKTEGGEEVYGADRLGDRFSNVRTPAAMFQVEAHENQIPTIELKSR